MQQLQTCFHPKVLVRKPNSISNVYRPWLRSISVPCGKCPSCLNNKMLRWVDRIEEENQFHKYCYHVTLTYAEECVHTISFYEKDDNTVYGFYDDKFVDIYCQHRCLFDVFTKPNRLNSDEARNARKRFDSAQQIARHKSGYGDNKIRYVEVRDVQLFLKRLRRKIQYRYGKTNQLRYYAAMEYSPEKLRPHWHVLFWFESSTIARYLSKMVSETWQNGFSKCKLASGRARKYVAKYINCLALLPAIYEHEDIRPRTLYSRRPAIGVPIHATKEIKEMFYNRNFDFVVKRAEKVKDIRFFSALENRWFPKCREFDSLTFNGKLTRYSIYDQVQNELNSHPDYGYIKPSNVIASNYVVKSWHSTNNMFDDYSFTVFGLSDYYISRRVYQISEELKMSVDNVVAVICDYYSHKALRQLREFYSFQERFMCAHPDDLRFLSQLYPTTLADLKRLHKFEQTPDYYNALVNFASSLALDYYDIPDDLHSSTQQYQDFQKRLAHDNIKTKILFEDVNIKSYNLND